MERTPLQWLARVTLAPVDVVELRAAPAIAAGILVVAASIGYLGTCHFDGVFDIHVGRASPLWYHVVELVVVWVVTAGALSLWARLLLPAQPAPRAHFLGQALARAPAVPAAIVALTPSFQDFTTQTVEVLSRIEEGAPIQAADLPPIHWGVVFMGVMTAWFVALSYVAFTRAVNAPRRRRLLAFVVALVTAEIATKLALGALIQLT